LAGLTRHRRFQFWFTAIGDCCDNFLSSRDSFQLAVLKEIEAFDRQLEPDRGDACSQAIDARSEDRSSLVAVAMKIFRERLHPPP
jgi:hypothetical protein